MPKNVSPASPICQNNQKVLKLAFLVRCQEKSREVHNALQNRGGMVKLKLKQSMPNKQQLYNIPINMIISLFTILQHRVTVLSLST